MSCLADQMSSPGFPELEELSIAALSDESRLINDDYLQRILKTSTKLQLLDVRGCARLTHESMIRLPTWDLKHLFLSGCAVTRDLGLVSDIMDDRFGMYFNRLVFDLQIRPRADRLQVGAQSDRIRSGVGKRTTYHR